VENYLTDYHQLIQIEASGFNNTLAPFEVCPNSNNAIGNLGSVKADDWVADIHRALPSNGYPVPAGRQFDRL